MCICITNKQTKKETCYRIVASPNGYGWDIYKKRGTKWTYCYNASNVDMLSKWLIQRRITGVQLESVADLPVIYNEAVSVVNDVLREAIEASALPAGSR